LFYLVHEFGTKESVPDGKDNSMTKITVYQHHFDWVNSDKLRGVKCAVCDLRISQGDIPDILTEYFGYADAMRGIRPIDQLPEEDELVEVKTEDGVFYATFSENVFWIDEFANLVWADVILWRHRIPFTEEAI
jgi:hypothetical protein